MESFEYHVTGRSPYFVIVILIAGLAVFGAILMQAPWWILLIWAISAAIMIWQYYLNPKSGMTLGKHTWRYYTEDGKQILPLQDIDRVEIAGESEGPDSVVVRLSDGVSYTLPPESYPSTGTLVAQLEQRGISVTQD